MTLPVLYILMRDDLDSLNPGKAMAQASHASNAFVKAHQGDDQSKPGFYLYGQWECETSQGFGTVLVLACNETAMNTAVNVAEYCGFSSGVVHDPTYPIVDGDVVHHIPLDTCGYVFGDKDDPVLQSILQHFELHL